MVGRLECNPRTSAWARRNRAVFGREAAGMARGYVWGYRVEGREPRHPFGRSAVDRGDAILHLGGRLVGEGDAQNLPRRSFAGGNQMREASREGSSFPGAGAGEDQDR